MKNITATFIFGMMTIIFLSGCVTTFRPIQPETLAFDDMPMDTGFNVKIRIASDVLNGPRCKIYRKMERKNKVNLIALHISNLSTERIFVPGDLVFSTLEGDTLFPLTFMTGTELLVKPVTNEENDNLVEVEVEGDLRFLFCAGKIVNTVKIVQSHIRFMKNMNQDYLQSRQLDPGSAVTGYLVVPVRKGTPLLISVHRTCLFESLDFISE